MKIGDLCEFKTNFPEADFWLTKKGNRKEIGKPSEKFSPDSIGVKVVRTDVLLPKFLYHVFHSLYERGFFEQIADVHDGGKRIISIEDIKNLPIG